MRGLTEVASQLKLEDFSFGKNGGDERDRTADLLNAIQALSQLSYVPIFTKQILRRILYKGQGI